MFVLVDEAKRPTGTTFRAVVDVTGRPGGFGRATENQTKQLEEGR